MTLALRVLRGFACDCFFSLEAAKKDKSREDQRFSCARLQRKKRREGHDTGPSRTSRIRMRFLVSREDAKTRRESKADDKFSFSFFAASRLRVSPSLTPRPQAPLPRVFEISYHSAR